TVGSQAQTSTGHWVATWSTALVGRPQVLPPPGPPGPPPFMTNACPQPPAPPTPRPTPPPGQTFGPPPVTTFTKQTLRQVVHTSVGGTRVRVVVSNALGTAPLTIGAAHIAARAKDDGIQTGGRAVTFSGRPTITIPANAIA